MDKYARFEAWLRENGAKFEQLELREYDCGTGGVMDVTGEEKKETTLTPEEEDSEMRGVHARQHIPPNSVIMSIPRQCLITVEMGQATPIGQAIFHSDLDLDAPKHIYLMIYLLWDRKVNGKNSFFYPYYEILPLTLKNMPIFWTPEELSYLQGSYLLHQIADRNQAITEDYRAICSIAPLAQICTLDEFKWARMCVCSRNFGLQIDGHRTSALVPHADMLNHYRPRETKWTFDEDRNSFTITSLQHIPAGAQVYDSYGQKCNHRFLLNYGFAVEDNREIDGFCPNEVPLELFVDPEDPVFAEKFEFWTRGEMVSHSLHGSSQMMSPGLLAQAAHVMRKSTSNIENQRKGAVRTTPVPTAATTNTSVVKRVRVCVSNNENTRLLFSLLRALACDDAELQAIASPNSDTVGAGVVRQATMFQFSESVRASQHHHHILTGTPTPAAFYRSCRDIRHPINIRNERAAMRLLLDVVSRHLSNYPTTLAQDMADLLDEQAFPRFSNKRHAKIQVRGEKEVLHHFALWARTALDVLDVIEEELQEERGSVEVKLTRTGRTVTEERPSFEYVIRRMEDDCDSGIHHTIIRFCADVLGSLRREESKHIKRQRAIRDKSLRSATAGYL